MTVGSDLPSTTLLFLERSRQRQMVEIFAKGLRELLDSMGVLQGLGGGVPMLTPKRYPDQDVVPVKERCVVESDLDSDNDSDDDDEEVPHGVVCDGEFVHSLVTPCPICTA